MDHPYRRLPDRCFWSRTAGRASLDGIWTPRFAVDPEEDRIASVGSCFADHIGRHLAEAGFVWLSDPEAERHPNAYGSFDLGTVYTVDQLAYWVEAALGEAPVPDTALFCEAETGRTVDLLRLGIPTPDFADRAAAMAARRRAVATMGELLRRATVLCFTLGLTEGWESPEGAPYPICPATCVRGLDPAAYRFVQADAARVRAGLDRLVACLRRANPGLKILLTVSPVPLAATATGGHVTVATAEAKAVLRTAAAEATRRHDDIDYFPAFELASGPAHGRDFFEADRRRVSPAGVAFVMEHFFRALGVADRTAPTLAPVVCDEEAYDPAGRAPFSAPASDLVLLGSSQIGELSRQLDRPHHVYMMAGSRLVQQQFDEDPATLFRPHDAGADARWGAFAAALGPEGLRRGGFTIVTDLACHSIWWEQEIRFVVNKFAALAGAGNLAVEPFHVEVMFQHRRAAHLAMLRKLAEHGNRVIWVADPPFAPANFAMFEAVLADLVKRCGVAETLIPRALAFPDGALRPDADANHGPPAYYRTVASALEELLDEGANSTGAAA